MAKKDQGRRWRRCRRVFCAVRVAFLLLIFFLVAAGAYLNQVGLPDFLKRPLLEKLHARGVDLQFTRLRLRWNRGVVAENVRFVGASPKAASPQMSLSEVELKLNHAALAKFQLVVDSLILHGGRLDLPLEETNQISESLSATNLEAQILFLPNDHWELDRLSASFAGVRVQLFGSITNASALRDWKLPKPPTPAQPSLTQNRLRELARIIKQLKFTGEPELSIVLHGDARDPESFHGVLSLVAAGAVTPWGTFTNGALTARLAAPNAATNQPQADFQLSADKILTPEGQVNNLLLTLHASTGTNSTNLVQARLEISASRIATIWVQSASTHLQAEWTHSLTNSIPLSATVEISLADTYAPLVSAGNVELTARLNPSALAAMSDADSQMAWWTNLAPYSLDWNCRLRDVHASDPGAGIFEFKELVCGGLWRAPDLTITNAHAELYRGKFDAHATLNVATRALAFEASSDFDAQKATPILTEGGREWLEQYSWEDPPIAHAVGSLVLPDWTNRQPDWRHEVLPTLWLHGDVAVGNAAFRDVPVSSATLHFNYTNMVWDLPDIVAIRPEGKIELANISDDRSKRYYFHVHSTANLTAFRRLLPPEAQKGLDSVIFTRPPVIDAEVWGHWHNLDETGVKASVSVTNFAIRGESATLFRSDVQYTNGFIVLTDARLERGAEYATASGLGIDPSEKKAYVTNGFSTLEPASFFRVIGPKVAKIMEPYRFLKPPSVHAYGTIPLADDVDPDLHFQIDGGPFSWLKFNVNQISGGADWVGQHLTLTNVAAEFYQGKLNGMAEFDFSPRLGNDFIFDLTATDANLQALMADLFTRSNHLEGRLSGQLNITRANSNDPKSWFGNGHVDLRDGLIWAIPIFGTFSPILDSLSGGLGESRADRGSASFTITNSVIRSDDLEIRAPALHMLYRGTVDFDGRVDAVVEAKRLLPDAPVLGWLLSTAFTPVTKLFVFKVTGTLSDPKSQPEFPVSKLLLIPLSPFQTLRDIMPAGASPNAPPTPEPQNPP